MLAIFSVGDDECHRVEVYSSVALGRERVNVDGQTVIEKRKFPIWFTDYMRFEVGDREKHLVELRYNTLTFDSRAYVDGKLHVPCLFPQVPAYNALLIGSFAAVLAAVALVIALAAVT